MNFRSCLLILRVYVIMFCKTSSFEFLFPHLFISTEFYVQSPSMLNCRGIAG